MNPETTPSNPNNSGNGTNQWETLRKIEVSHLSPEDDLSRACELLYEVDPYIFPDFLGDKERAKELGPQLFTDSETGLFSFKRTLVAKENGHIFGILCYRTSEVEPWDGDAVKSRFEQTGVELPEQFDRANEQYMKKITDAELPEGAAEIEFLATAPEARGRGIASKLIGQLKNSGKFSELHLDVLGDNEPAIHLYEKQGFRTAFDFPSYPDGATTVHHMIAKLNPTETEQ